MIGCSWYFNGYPLDGSVTNAKVITGVFTARDAQQVFYGEDAKEVEVQKVQVKQEDIISRLEYQKLEQRNQLLELEVQKMKEEQKEQVSITTMKALLDQQKKEIDEKVTFQV